MRFADLRKEFEEVRIGPQIWGLVVELSREVAHRYPEAVYNNGWSWNSEAIEELAQDVVADCLLGEGQLQYIFDEAETLESFKRLAVRQVKRTLFRRRSTTVVDRLLRRIKEIIAAPPFRVDFVGNERWITTETSSALLQTFDRATLRRLADEVGDIPRLPQSPISSRASMVYTSRHLQELVGRVVEKTGGVTQSDLAKILEILLTAWVPTFLGGFEESDMPLTETFEDSAEVINVREFVTNLATSMDDADCLVLLCKSQGVADSAIAKRLSRSRPWVADKKSRLLSTIGTAVMADIPVPRHGFAFDLLLSEAAARLEGENDGNT